MTRPRLLVPLIMTVVIALAAIAAPWLSGRSFSDQDLLAVFASPGDGQGVLGTDGLGRDTWARLLFGLRISLGVVLFSQLVQLAIGVPVGVISGYCGGRVDRVLMRVVDTVLSFPVLVFALVISANVRANATSGRGWWASLVRWIDQNTSGLAPVFIVLVLVFWASTARMVRGTVLKLREQDYVRAARSMGASHRRIMTVHLLPHIWSQVIVATTVAVPLAILTEAALSFLKLGVQSPTPSLGLMIAEGVGSINSYPLQVLLPSAALVLLTLVFEYLGEGLRLHLAHGGEQR
jgi:oligopeptide transport system permease protein